MGSQIKIEGSKEIVSALRNAEKIIGGEELRERIGEYVVNSVRYSFARSRDAYGEKWLPLKYRKGKPLVLSRALRDSIRADLSRQSGIYVGSRLKYAATHQFGRDNIPARPYLPWDGLNDSTFNRIRKALNDILGREWGG